MISTHRPTLYLDRPDGRIAYDRTGRGPLVILVPGMGDIRDTYRYLVTALLDAGFDVVTTDLRGHGDSDTTFTSYGDGDTADDLLALIDRLGGPAAIVGNSMAAGAAVIAAARKPRQVTALALLGPFVREPASESSSKRAFLRVMMAPAWAAVVWNRYLPSLYAGAKPSDFDRYRSRMIAALRRPGAARAFSRTTRETHAEAGRVFAEVTAQTLVVMGALDPDFPDPAAEAEWIGRTLTAEVAMVPAAGHYPQSQQPHAVLAALLPFLERALPNA